MPRKLLVTVYKYFIKPHLIYGDIIYDEAYSATFHRKLESIQYNAALAITVAIQVTSKEKLYQELGFASLQQRRWYRKLCYFYKIFKEKSPNYLLRFIPKQNTRHAMRNSKGIPQCRTNHEYFKNSFFPATIKEWNITDSDIRSSESLNVFKSKVLKFIRPKTNSFFNCLNPKGVKLITRLPLGLSHLRDHKFKHNFQGFLNPISSCGIEVKTTAHFLLNCPSYLNERKTLLDIIESALPNILEQSDSFINNVVVFGDTSLGNSSNTIILNATINYITSTKRFDGSIFTF